MLDYPISIYKFRDNIPEIQGQYPGTPSLESCRNSMPKESQTWINIKNQISKINKILKQVSSRKLKNQISKFNKVLKQSSKSSKYQSINKISKYQSIKVSTKYQSIKVSKYQQSNKTKCQSKLSITDLMNCINLEMVRPELFNTERWLELPLWSSLWYRVAGVI